jgi:hypothetical protein
MLYLIFGKKKCHRCRKLSHKKVLYCWLCGSSFNLRICVSGHQNPAWVHKCQTCGKDRSLMSQPDTAVDLWFVRDLSKRLTYVPSHKKAGKILGFVAVHLGATILVCALFAIINSLLMLHR